LFLNSISFSSISFIYCPTRRKEAPVQIRITNTVTVDDAAAEEEPSSPLVVGATMTGFVGELDGFSVVVGWAVMVGTVVEDSDGSMDGTIDTDGDMVVSPDITCDGISDGPVLLDGAIVSLVGSAAEGSGVGGSATGVMVGGNAFGSIV